MTDKPIQTGASVAPSDEVFRPDLLERQRVSRTLWLSIIEGGFTQIFLVWTSGSVLTGLMLYLGATTAQLAAVASIPLLFQVLNPVAAWLVSNLGSRKNYMIFAGFFGRMVWLVPVVLPFLPLDPARFPGVVLGVVLFSSLFQNTIGPVWASMMADVVPDETRGRYFGLRGGLMGIIGMTAGLGSGWFLDRAPEPAGFQIVLFVAVLCALVGIRLYSFHYEPRVAKAGPSLWQTVKAPLVDRTFRPFLWFSAYWTVSVMLASPFVIPYFIRHLGMSFTQLAVWSAIASVATLFLSSLWGRLADRVGHKHVLKVTTFLAGSAHPACWMLATPGHLGFIWFSGIVEALSWGGINTAMFNLSVVTAPREKRMVYLAVAGAVTGIVGFCAGLLSGVLLEFLLKHEAWIGGFHWTGYHSLFTISAILRMQAWMLLGPVKEARAIPTRDILKWLWLRTTNLRPWRVQ